MLTFLVFAITFLGSWWLISRAMNSTDAVLERILEKRNAEPVRNNRQSPWQTLAAKIGRTERGKSQDRLRKLFARAGIRSPRAESIFAGLKTLGGLVGAVTASLALAVRHSEGSRVIMGAIAGLAMGYLLPDRILEFRIRSRKTRIERALPNTLDLLTICVEAGLGLDQAIMQVSRELGDTYPDISEELSMISLEMRAGKRRADCLRAFGERTGIPEVKKLAAVLIQADRFGTSIAQSLRVHSDHLRTERRQKAEEKAAKLGVKLVFPIFFFIMPSLFVITVGPVIVRIFTDLLPMMNSL